MTSGSRRIAHIARIALLACLASPAVASAQVDAFSLEGLVITASPLPRSAEAVASHVTIVTAAQLEELGDRSLGEALRDVAGLDVVRGGSFGATTSVFLRGGESDYTLVLVDGVQVNQAGGGFDFSTLTTDNVERIEIVRGPASALYGSDAVTGVIHVITRTGRGVPSGSLGIRAGSYGRLDLSAGLAAGTDRAGYSVSLARRATDGVLAFNNEHRSTVLSGRARFLADDRTELGLSLRHTEQEYHFPTESDGTVVDRNAFTFSDGSAAQATVRRAVSERLSVEGVVGLSEVDGGTDDRADGPADSLGFYGFNSLDRFRRVSGVVKGHVAVRGGTVTAGFEAERESQRSFSESLSEFGPSTGRSDHVRRNRAAFAHLATGLGALAVTGGARWEDNERFGSLVTWQVGVTASTLEGAGPLVRASIGTAIKEPTFFENFATGFALGNAELEPERSSSWEVGLEQRWVGDALRLLATYFDQGFEDLIQYTFSPPTPGAPNFFNVARASARGLEVEGRATGSRLSGGLTLTWLDTEVVDAGFDEGPGATFVEGEALLRRPELTWSVDLTGRLAPALTAHARLRMVGDRADRDFSTFPATPVTLPSYTDLAAGATWRVPRAVGPLGGADVSIRAENLLDERYEEVLGFPAPGRALYLGVTVSVGGAGR